MKRSIGTLPSLAIQQHGASVLSGHIPLSEAFTLLGMGMDGCGLPIRCLTVDQQGYEYLVGPRFKGLSACGDPHRIRNDAHIPGQTTSIRLDAFAGLLTP
ncbi:hypothetical protein VTN02DRAFT_4178 [Thermoascus thermophilus]